MKASVVVCTYNRAVSLKRTLASLAAMAPPDDAEWELLVIDNNSPDATREAVEEFAGTAPLTVRYVFEPQQGLSYARNRGVREARGEIIAFTDDDIVVDALWLRNIVRAFREHDAGCIGGKIIPLWSQPRPAWFTSELFWYLALLDLGDEVRILTEPQLWGANFAVKASLFSRYGYFNPAAGRIGEKLYAGEETQFIRTLIGNGEKVCYVPDIVVHHVVPAERIRKSYFRRTIFDRGEQLALETETGGDPTLMGVPLQELPSVAGKLWNYLHALMRRQRRAFNEQLDLVGNMGYIVGKIKYRNRSSKALRKRSKREPL
ncbi:MAG: glycosyltransferase [Nitrospirota bacterium]